MTREERDLLRKQIDARIRELLGDRLTRRGGYRRESREPKALIYMARPPQAEEAGFGLAGLRVPSSDGAAAGRNNARKAS